MLIFSCSPKVVSNNDIVKIDDTTVIAKDSCHSMVWQSQVELSYAKDTIHQYRDSIDTLNSKIRELTIIANHVSDELSVAEFKLLRIREYNRIAGQRNNIKYLRGWINRTLKD